MAICKLKMLLSDVTFTFKRRNKYFIIILSLLLTGIYFWKVVVQGLIPFPGDLLVGSYYPWLENKHGFAVGVPVKNPLISDVFSQLYPWKVLIADSFKTGHFPLWNPYSYFGYPLLANFQSGALNIFNIFLVLFNHSTGWALLIMSQSFLSLITMYYFLKALRFKNLPSLIGSVSYSFSGFAIIWSQFATAGFAMIWLPLFFLVIEKSFTKQRALLFTPVLVFLLVTAGHFQACVYTLFATSAYYAYRLRVNNNFSVKQFSKYILLLLFGLAISAVQLLPTVELASLSVRFQEQYIENVNFGLLPFKNIITLLIPDFFGNPATGNFWGFLNYHETVIYGGVIGSLALISAFFDFKKLKNIRFFLCLTVFSFLMLFDSPIGKLLYLNDIPLLSTSAAGRIVFLLAFSQAVIIASWVQTLSAKSVKRIVAEFGILLAFVIIVGLTLLDLDIVFRGKTGFAQLISENPNLLISARNTVYPSLLLGFLFFTSLLFRQKQKLAFYGILLLVVADLFRFGWKYTPFVPRDFVFPPSPITDFLSKEGGVFRVDKEFGPLFTPNTWISYKLASPSGYDPLAPLASATYHLHNLDKQVDQNPSRYSEIRNYDSEALGAVNVKYLLAIRRTIQGEYMLGGDSYNYILREEENFKEVFASESTIVLENTSFRERARILSENGSEVGTATITKYEPQEIEINYFSNQPAYLVITDTWYPGWKAYLNGTKVPIEKYEYTFRKVAVGKGEGKIVMTYEPTTFRLGGLISLFSLILLVGTTTIFRKREKSDKLLS